MTFEEWKKVVDRYILGQVGLNSDALPDYRYRDDYEDGVRPETSGRRAIRAAKADMGF